MILIEFVFLPQEELEEKKLEWEEIYEKDTKARKAELKSLEVTWLYKYKYKYKKYKYKYINSNRYKYVKVNKADTTRRLQEQRQK